MVPPFDPATGNLPSGVHTATWDELVERYGYTAHRRALLDGFMRALDALRIAGCRRVYLDGSFVSVKQVPGDFDACWDVDGVDAVLLARLAPEMFDFRAGRVAQKAAYGGEFFPAPMPADASGVTILEYFQRDKRSGDPKGIVVLSLDELP